MSGAMSGERSEATSKGVPSGARERGVRYSTSCRFAPGPSLPVHPHLLGHLVEDLHVKVPLLSLEAHFCLGLRGRLGTGTNQPVGVGLAVGVLP